MLSTVSIRLGCNAWRVSAAYKTAMPLRQCNALPPYGARGLWIHFPGCRPMNASFQAVLRGYNLGRTICQGCRVSSLWLYSNGTGFLQLSLQRLVVLNRLSAVYVEAVSVTRLDVYGARRHLYEELVVYPFCGRSASRFIDCSVDVPVIVQTIHLSKLKQSLVDQQTLLLPTKART